MDRNRNIEDSENKNESSYSIKKVVHIITGLGDGGAEAALYRMVMSESSNEENIIISLSNKSKYGRLLEKNNITVFSLDMGFNLKAPYKIIKLFSLLKRLKPDAIQTWMYHADLVGGLVGRMSGCKNIVWGVYCTNFLFGETKFSTILIIFLNSFLSRFIPKKIIFCAEEGKNFHEKYGFSRDKLIYIPNGIPHETFKINPALNNDLKKELNIDNSNIILGIVGRYSPMKDHINFIKALQKLSSEQNNFTAIFIGENLDIHNKTLVNQIKKYGIERKVRLLGPRKDLPNLMNLIDLNILSSSFGEGQSTVLCESMLSGTPSIATDTGDSALIIGDYGWVVPPSNSQMLCDQIVEALEIMKDKPEWNKRVIGGREHIMEKFTLENMVKSYKSVWSLK